MKFYLESLGCAKNQVDSEDIIAQCEAGDWKWVNDPALADVIIVNTCGFISSAREEAIDTLLEFKQSYPKAKVVAAGCLSQRYKEQLVKLLPEIDGFIGNRDLSQIFLQLQGMLKDGRNYAPSTFGEIGGVYSCSSDFFRSRRLTPNHYAYVKIAEGCNHGCSYCAIPLIRGALTSKPVKQIVNEIDLLQKDGVKEIVLVAQDLFAYGSDLKEEGDFLFLLKKIFELPGNFYIRLLYMHPDCFDMRLLDFMKNQTRLIPYLDIPLQHCNNEIVASMNRRGDFTTYLSLIKKIRESLPQIVIRTTFLLGHPGENKKSLTELQDFIKAAQFDWAGFFVYSKEEGTASSKQGSIFKNKMSIKRANRWLSKLQQLQQDITTQRLNRFVGKKIKVIVEEAVQGESLFLARAYFHAPEVDGLVVLHGDDCRVGQIVEAKIIKVNGIDLEAILA